VVFENNLEANNAGTAAGFFDVMPLPYADLEVSSVAVPATGESGQPLTISWSVVNRGIGPTNIASWNDTVNLARNPDGSDVVASLGTFNHTGALGVDKSYDRTVDVTIPHGLSGPFYAVVATGGPFEFIHSDNNHKTSSEIQVTLSPFPDLFVSEITAPSMVISGTKIDVTWTVHNDGTGPANGTWADRVFLRPAGNPNGQPIDLGTFTSFTPLDAGKFYTRSEQFNLSSTLQGLFQVVVTTNVTGSLFEHTATTNNTLPDDLTLLVSLAPRPDLQVQSITAPPTVTSGGTLSVQFTIINQGTVATTTPRWQDKVYLSLDNRISKDDIVIGSLSNSAALGPGESYVTQTGVRDRADGCRGSHGRVSA
jgi:hypothetical protein